MEAKHRILHRVAIIVTVGVLVVVRVVGGVSRSRRRNSRRC